MPDNQAKTGGNQPAQSQQRSDTQQVANRPQWGMQPRRWQDPFFLSPREFFTANPFALMRRMSEEMDRAFGDFGFGRGQGETSMWSPAIEVTERDGNYVVHAELPGLKPEDVKVEVTNDALVIQGERKSTQDEKQGGVRRTELRYGQFYRSIPLPEGVNPEQVRAKFENGILEVTTPVPAQKSNARQIPIDAGAAQSTGKQPAVEQQKAAKATA
ncbi:MAG TPA: Hsp20/alpha crystallin family protein [Bryobacteraceae bacterium]|jgi:HSP20 family protein|nr:Hsp20/alpha crystallin family protein [Bryobacteraceae bacterium]